MAIWRPLAERGDADAQFNLGQAYRLGRGVPINLGAAKTWFERAANGGHLDAETTLGLLQFQNGEQAQGLKWLKQAADQGEPRALLVYGTALYNGDGVTQDRVLGYAYVSRAAAQGLEPAKDTLAQLDQLMPVADRQKGCRAGPRQGQGRAAAELQAGCASPRRSRRLRNRPLQRSLSPRLPRQAGRGGSSSALSRNEIPPKRSIGAFRQGRIGRPFSLLHCSRLNDPPPGGAVFKQSRRSRRLQRGRGRLFSSPG